MQLRNLLKLLFAGASVSSLAIAGCTQERQFDPQPPANSSSSIQNQQRRQREVPYVPTPQIVVNQMLAIADVNKNDVLYDLGSGDGRIVITAAQKFGTRGVGIDINPERIKEANTNARQAGVTDDVEFRQQDLFQTDFSEATVVTLYLLPEVNLRLRPKLLKELKPGTRVVSHAFNMGDWQPQRVEKIAGSTIYYWVVPENSQ